MEPARIAGNGIEALVHRGPAWAWALANGSLVGLPHDVGFRVEGLGLRVWGLGLKVEGLGFGKNPSLLPGPQLRVPKKGLMAERVGTGGTGP